MSGCYWCLWSGGKDNDTHGTDKTRPPDVDIHIRKGIELEIHTLIQFCYLLRNLLLPNWTRNVSLIRLDWFSLAFHSSAGNTLQWVWVVAWRMYVRSSYVMAESVRILLSWCRKIMSAMLWRLLTMMNYPLPLPPSKHIILIKTWVTIAFRNISFRSDSWIPLLPFNSTRSSNKSSQTYFQDEFER